MKCRQSDAASATLEAKASQLIVPSLYPVSLDEIVTLEALTFVPDALKCFWLSRGHGFFCEDESRTLIDPDIANRLISPLEVVDLLRNAHDLAPEFAHGLPFFERNDRRFLLIGDNEVILSADVNLRTIAASFDEFLEKLLLDPTFYDNGVER